MITYTEREAIDVLSNPKSSEYDKQLSILSLTDNEITTFKNLSSLAPMYVLFKNNAVYKIIY